MAKPLPKETIQRIRREVQDGKTKYRVAKEMGLGEYVDYSHTSDLPSINLREPCIKGKTLDQLIDKKDLILESWKEKGPWGLIEGMDEEKWKKIMKQGIENQSSKIDTVVTTDIHRLIRLPNTLHGKTGLLKTSFPTDDIERFDPLKSAIALKSGEVTILVDRSPKFRLGEESFGPYEDQKVELPMAAAVFLLCKDAARMVEQDV